jgi:hypothetical protein
LQGDERGARALFQKAQKVLVTTPPEITHAVLTLGVHHRNAQKLHKQGQKPAVAANEFFQTRVADGYGLFRAFVAA